MKKYDKSSKSFVKWDKSIDIILPQLDSFPEKESPSKKEDKEVKEESIYTFIYSPAETSKLSLAPLLNSPIFIEVIIVSTYSDDL